MEENSMYSAAETLDSLLGKDDGELLAAIALYKSSIITVFGRDGIVEMMKNAIDNAVNVEYFSRRSRKEISYTRPEVNLKVNHVKALEASQDLKVRFAGRDVRDTNTLMALKAAVIHSEVCEPLATKIMSELAPHWEKSKKFVETKYSKVAADKMALMLCTMFSVRIADPTTANMDPNDRMCILSIFI